MPSDIIGTEVIEEDRATGARGIRFMPGPIFANIILADEINRTPPKTQAALLEAMQEYQVTVGGTRHQLDRPLFVLATQNPIEQEGTYPLPEAQLDRFMLNVVIGYPTAADERTILKQTTTGAEPSVIANKVKEGKDDYGYNARTGNFENLVAAGVIDPAKVTITALQNAASIAGLLLTTDALVAEKKEDKPAPAGGPGMGGMGGMGGMDMM